MAFGRPTTSKSIELATENSSDLIPSQADESSHDAAVENDQGNLDNTYQAQSATKIWLLLISLMITMFLVALDRTIISTV